MRFVRLWVTQYATLPSRGIELLECELKIEKGVKYALTFNRGTHYCAVVGKTAFRTESAAKKAAIRAAEKEIFEGIKRIEELETLIKKWR